MTNPYREPGGVPSKLGPELRKTAEAVCQKRYNDLVARTEAAIPRVHNALRELASDGRRTVPIGTLKQMLNEPGLHVETLVKLLAKDGIKHHEPSASLYMAIGADREGYLDWSES